MSELERVLKQLNKKFGEGYVSYGADASYNDYKRHKFGIFALDVATGGGIPERKVISVAGKYSAGKTTSAICAAAEVQKRGGKVAWIDTEGSLDPIWAAKFGVSYKDLVITQPSTIEQVSDTIEPLLMTGEFDLIIFDSIAATPTQKELDASADQKSMGGKGREVGLLMRKIVARINQNKKIKTSVFIINQLRDKVSGFGGAEYMPGGNQLHNQSDIIIYLRTSKWVGEAANPEGITVKFRVAKNKTAPPLKTDSFELLFKGKINNNKTVIDKAVEYGLVEKAGSWYSFGDKKGQGADKLVNLLEKKELKKLKKQIIGKLNE